MSGYSWLAVAPEKQHFPLEREEKKWIEEKNKELQRNIKNLEKKCVSYITLCKRLESCKSQKSGDLLVHKAELLREEIHVLCKATSNTLYNPIS